ncbi:MAG TPA: AraC family ligand binding domain-containing protein, partial [bacterium]|nr:AraC family ligand binding domain-containing protein [bacterium]
MASSSGGQFRFSLTNGIEALNGGLFVSPGYGTHPTRVIDSHELIFVAQGSLDLFEEKENLHADANQTLVLFPGKRHGGRLPYAPDLNFYWVHFRIHEGLQSHATLHVPRVADVRDPEFLTEMFCRFI